MRLLEPMLDEVVAALVGFGVLALQIAVLVAMMRTASAGPYLGQLPVVVASPSAFVVVVAEGSLYGFGRRSR